MKLEQYKRLCDAVHPEPNEGKSWDRTREEYFRTKMYVALGAVAEVDLEGQIQEGDLSDEQEARLLSALADLVCFAVCATDTEELKRESLQAREWSAQRLEYGEPVRRWQSYYYESDLGSTKIICCGYGVHPHDAMLLSAKKLSETLGEEATKRLVYDEIR